MGNVTSILDWVQPDYNLSLSYDGLHRLTSVEGGTAIGNSTIAYDALGNIESYTSKDRNLTYTYDRQTNRLSSVTGAGTNGKYANLAYDTRGNITNNGTYQLSFNIANQLTSAKNNTYLYDGHNRRVKQVEQSGTSYSLYSQDGTLLYREKGNTITGEGVNYIYLGKKLIAKYGDVTPTSEADSRQHYRPFGETLEEAKDDVGYTGHKFDKELGLSYMQARYYDPVIGRFYSNDPAITLEHIYRGNSVHGFNRYAYANNNPYRYTDPDGKFPTSMDQRLDQRVERFANGEITAEEYSEENFAEGAGGLVGAGIVVTRGKGLLGFLKNLFKKGGCSFSPDTLILTKEGLKPIVEVKVGDLVLAKSDDKTGGEQWREVTDTFRDWHEQTIELTVADKNGTVETIVTTAEHPFYVEKSGWLPASDLVEGYSISGANGNSINIEQIVIKNDAQYAYNMTVDTDHTYFVGTTNMWVHNKCKQERKNKSGDSKKKGDKEHTKGKRPSTKGKHEKGRSRNKKDKKGGEKGDERRPYKRK
ncbi:hypothetical protein CEX98_03110 [Pseudoalteromonas piscicida]|uniref:Hint domain-containing protein n=1 Tax=Pseudoalteromonas piscicida TaxID=43662 RepID=A0A2A5JUW8_PSEO7|nr:hypothetical protein CEX98_03110 [Pseudoalteromonas piscicida]